MKKINVTTEKEVVCRIDYSKSTLSPEQIKDVIKKSNLIQEYNEINTDMKNCVIKFIKYVHNFTIEM